ncbi:MAG TPA: hypothetical protein VF809_01950 [Candidatus Saccharimonadales bacterium]
MFHRTSLQQHLSQKIGMSLGAGAAVWIALLVNGSAAIRNSVEASHNITFGPLLLNTLSKQRINGGFKAAIYFEPNLVWYAILWVVIGIAIGLAVTNFAPKKDTD